MDRSVDFAVLHDLHLWGADTLKHFQHRLGEAKTSELILDKLVKVVDGNTFKYVSLGPQGRKQLGLRPHHTTEAATAVRHIMRRDARAQLEQLGMTFVGAEDRALRRFRDAEGKTYFLATSLSAKTAGYTARAVRRLLSKYRPLLLETKGILIIATPQPGRLSRTLTNHEDYVKTLQVDASICKVGAPCK